MPLGHTAPHEHAEQRAERFHADVVFARMGFVVSSAGEAAIVADLLAGQCPLFEGFAILMLCVFHLRFVGCGLTGRRTQPALALAVPLSRAMVVGRAWLSSDR